MIFYMKIWYEKYTKNYEISSNFWLMNIKLKIEDNAKFWYKSVKKYFKFEILNKNS